MARWITVLALVSGVAHAAPNTLTHQGRLVDELGQPANGTYELVFTLHTDAQQDSVEWTEQDTVTVADGYYATTLGDDTPLATLDLATQTYWLQVGIHNGATMTPRTELSAVPSALSLSGGFRPPSMTTVERNALSALPGQMVFNTDAAEIQVFDGSSWTQVGGNTASTGQPKILVWGRNSVGQLGLDHTTQIPAPIEAPGLPSGIVAIDGGGYRHSTYGSLRAITSDGRLFGAGYGNHLPNDARSNVDTFTEFPTSVTWARMYGAKGGLHTCGIDTSGAGYCYGYRVYGVLGDGSGSSGSYNMTPQLIAGGHTWKVLAPAGFYDGTNHDGHTCGVTTDTGVANGYCWGLDTAGVLGNGSRGSDYNGPSANTRLDEPAPGWPNGIEWATIDAGYYQACGVDINGGGWCWGDAATGRLGTGDATDRPVPTAVAGGHTWQTLQIGEDHACGLRVDGKVLCFGDNPYGQLGTGTTIDELEPALVLGNKTFRHLSVGQFTTCAIDTADRLFCWGYNGNGTVGDGTTTDRLIPTPVFGDYRFRDVVVGQRAVIAITR